MHWIRQVWELLTRLTPRAAQRRVDTVDRTLA